MAAAAPARVRTRKPLSFQERQVLLCVCVGLNNDQIAGLLNARPGTVSSLINRIKKKYGIEYWGRWDMAIRLNAAMLEQYQHPRAPIAIEPSDDLADWPNQGAD